VVDANSISNKNRCVGNLYKLYLSKILQNYKEESFFYLRPLVKFSDDKWYTDKAIGLNTITKTITKMCILAGLEGHFTNHSLSAASASRLYAQGEDEQIISETTDDSSNAVRLYIRISNQQKEFISNIINGEKKIKIENNGENSISINLNINI